MANSLNISSHKNECTIRTKTAYEFNDYHYDDHDINDNNDE